MPRFVLPLVVLVASASFVSAQAPVVAEGECLWLLGAPPGEPAAATNLAFDGTRIYDDCVPHIPYVEVGRDVPHELTATLTWMSTPLGSTISGCTLAAWTDQAFIVDSTGPSALWVAAAGKATGELLGKISSADTNGVGIKMTLEVIRLTGAGFDVVKEVQVLAEASHDRRLLLDEDWAVAVPLEVPGPGDYRVRLRLRLEGSASFVRADFGSAGSGRGATMTSLQVCAPSAGTQRGDGDDIERDLYERRCMPSLWLPASHGGRLEEGRALVSGLIDAAEASGSNGTNIRNARVRLSRADAEIAAGSYQQACRSLSESLRFLTTP